MAKDPRQGEVWLADMGLAGKRRSVVVLLDGVGRNKSSQFRHIRPREILPELRRLVPAYPRSPSAYGSNQLEAALARVKAALRLACSL